MRNFKTILLTLSLLLTGSGVVNAQNTSSSEYQAALAAITDGANYYIKTDVNGTYYYVTTGGSLTSDKNNAGIFTITKTSGGHFGTGFRIDSGSERFTNPPLTGNNVANLNPGNFAHSTGDRADWERQILYLNEEGKYAIRSCNVQDATSSWNDAGRTHWTWSVNPVTPCYSYDPVYVWEFEIPPVIVNVTYKLVENGSEVNSSTVKQEANSAINVPKSFDSFYYSNLWHKNFYYDYAISGTIGDTDCTITITRSVNAGAVHALNQLSNNKAYNIGCKRGNLLTADGYMKSTCLNATTNALPLGKFAIINYENNYYLYSVDASKFVTVVTNPNDNTKFAGALTNDLINNSHGVEDAIKIEAKTDPYFYFSYTIDSKNYGLNTNGNDPCGYVIDGWTNADEGNQYYMVEAGDFDPTAAIALLDDYFHPSYTVKYVVKDANGNTLFTSDPQPTTPGATITSLPAEYKREFYTYNDVNVTISNQETTIEFTATWGGPFVISTNFASAHWYDMAMRSTWYVTSAVKDGDGAYKTQNANTMGLVEDSYQWAFIGNGYTGFKLINKAEGDGKSFGWTDAAQTNSGIPTMMADGEGHHLWKIVSSTNNSVPANSFCLNVEGTNLYINQFGGAGGSMKFWDSGNNISDAGSAFTIFDVPSNFASFVVDEIAPALEATGYFAFTDAAKTTIGWDESYKTECSFDRYKSMKDALANALTDQNNMIFPETGYYRIKSAYYEGYYMCYTENEIPVIGSEKNAPESITSIVKLTAGTDHKYTITVGGLNATAPAQSRKVGIEKTGAELTAKVTAPGVGTFTTGEQFGALHSANSQSYNEGNGYLVVGWTVDAEASQWIIEDATIETKIEATITDAGYATLNALWPVTIPSGVKAYTGKVNGQMIDLTEISGTIPAATPVILEGNPGTYTFNFADDVEAISGNDLIGTFKQMAAPNGCYILQKQGDKVGFYEVDTEFATPNIPAFRAYLPAQGGNIKAYQFNFGGEDGISTLNKEQASKTIFDLAGRRVSNATKGIYIVNGKKVIK